MIKVCGGTAWSHRHLWMEVYLRLPRHRTLVLMWTYGMWCTAEVSDRSFRTVTGNL